MLKKARQVLAAVVFVLVTLLFVDVSGLLHGWLSWLADIQFLPALLAVNVGVVVALVALTLIFGRIYCSVICPLGVMQDLISRLHSRFKKNRFSHSPERKALRYGFLALFVVALAAGVGSLAALLAPYSSYGRMAENLLRPVWAAGNNVLAAMAERADSYTFYSVDVWVKSLPTFVIAAVSLVVIGWLAWRGGRTYCNTVCPVGTALSWLARFSWLKVRIDTAKCNSCGLCERNCKASCIDSKTHQIDYSRCVVCGDCIGKCHQGALSFGHAQPSPSPSLPRGERDASPSDGHTDSISAGVAAPSPRERAASSSSTTISGVASPSPRERAASPLPTTILGVAAPSPRERAGGEASPSLSRRSFLLGAAMATTAAALAQEKKKVDGGLAAIEDKQPAERATPIIPPGAYSAQHFARHCTGCQLCVAQCPNGVLRPSTSLLTMMQPVMSFERGFCRPECTRCSEVCPTEAINPITRADKSAMQIGHAVWIRKNCVPLTDGVECGNCARHCPTGAITMVPSVAADPKSPKVPVVNESRCIGCGSCEYHCPARPFSAIYVEGHELHRII